MSVTFAPEGLGGFEDDAGDWIEPGLNVSSQNARLLLRALQLPEYDAAADELSERLRSLDEVAVQAFGLGVKVIWS